MTERPRVENAPGINWRRTSEGWEAIWRARTDLVKRGFLPKNHHLWSGTALTEIEAKEISDNCRRLQDEMLVFSRGGLPHQINAFDGTIRTLVNCYQTDPDSTYHKRRYHVRQATDKMLRRVVDRHGAEDLRDITGRTLLAWHKEWSDGEQKLAMGHAFVGLLRTLFAFGATMLADAECERLSGVLHRMRFKAPKPRDETLTAEQAAAIRKVARQHFGWQSIAFAQALQFDLMLRQKDVIGEWIPQTEPGLSDVTSGSMKWLRGLRWNEIDGNLMLRHNTSKREKDLTVDLKLAPMVLEEIKLGICTQTPSGPLVICDTSGLPYSASEFRRKWRLVADKAGVPKNVRNMDSRAGAISEATDAGADLEHVRHAATHSDIAMTQRYSRGSADKIANVQRLRVEHRAKPKKID